MIVRDAKAIARQWVIEEASTIARFRGAFFHGGTTWLADDAVQPATSDLDVMLVLADPSPSVKLGKVRYRDVLLDVSDLPLDDVRSPDQVLADYRLAGSFRVPTTILDPTGHLTALQVAVAAEYANRRWVIRRREHAEANIRRHLRSVREDDPFHDQVTGWLFGTGVTTHVLLVAGLENPTVRRRYEAARLLLTSHGHGDFYEFLLEQLGCAEMSRKTVETHLATMTEAFDAATAVVTTPFFFASDISDVARPIAIAGSREVIERGDHRAAIFWIVATYARCRKVFVHDAPEGMRDAFDDGFRSLLADLGIVSFADLRARGEQVASSLPRVRAVADAIMAANQRIDD